MANTFTSIHLHLVFRTKGGTPWITREIEERMWAYLGGVARENKMTPIRIGGMEDHIHMLLGFPPTLAPSQGVQQIKGASSKWVKEVFPALADFRWQDGYGAFAVSKSGVPDVVRYIERQREHHEGRSFKDEYLALLDKHGLEYDERFVFG